MKGAFIDIRALEINPSRHLYSLLSYQIIHECLKTTSHERLAEFLRQSSPGIVETHDRYITLHRLLAVSTCQSRLMAVPRRLVLYKLNVLAIKFVLPR